MFRSVLKTKIAVIIHEAPLTSGFAAELSSRITERCFSKLKCPVERICGWDSPFPLIHESIYLPNFNRCYSKIKELVHLHC